MTETTETTPDNVRHLPWTAGQKIPDRDDRDWITTEELVHEADISYRQADYWTRTGLLAPIDAATPGSGHLRRFPGDQVERAKALHDLLAGGITLVTCRLVIDQIVTDGHATLGHLTITRETPSEAS